MIGELVYEHKGRIIVQRILDIQGPKMEVTLSSYGKFNGIDVTHLITYWTKLKKMNLIYGESPGVLLTKEVETDTERGYGFGEYLSSGRREFEEAHFL